MINGPSHTGMSAFAAGYKAAAAAKMLRTSLDVAADQGAAALDLLKAADLMQAEGQAIAAAGVEIAGSEQVGQLLDLLA